MNQQNTTTEIVPAIIPKNLDDLKVKLYSILGATNFVQIDIVDGLFVKNTGFPYLHENKKEWRNLMSESDGLPYWQNFDFEIDLMVNLNKSKVALDDFIKLGPKSIVFHYEALGNAYKFITNLDPYIKNNIEVGLALNNDTNLDVLDPIIDQINFVQLMGIEQIGVQGSSFDERVIDRAKQLHTKYPNLKISIDGAVNDSNIVALCQAGASKFVIGSAIFKTLEPKQTIKSFEQLVNNL